MNKWLKVVLVLLALALDTLAWHLRSTFSKSKQEVARHYLKPEDVVKPSLFKISEAKKEEVLS